MTRVLSALVLILGLSLAGCANLGVPLHEIAPEINESLYLGPDLIRSGDELQVEFPELSSYDTTAIVRRDGAITLPAIGEVRAAGRSVEELRRELIERYRTTPQGLQDVVVNVAPDGLGLTVSGEVGSPGIVQLQGYRLTLTDAIGRAGGHLKASALLGNTVLVRRAPRTGSQRSWRIDARPHHWGKGEPIHLQPHDLILVPNTPVDDVNIWIDKYINQNVPGATVIPLVLGIAIGSGTGP